MSNPSSSKRKAFGRLDESPTKRLGLQSSLMSIEGTGVRRTSSFRGSSRSYSDPRDLLRKLEHAQPSIRCVLPDALPQPPLVVKLRQSLDLVNLFSGAIPKRVKTQIQDEFPGLDRGIPETAFGNPNEQEVHDCLRLLVPSVEDVKTCCNKQRDEDAFVYMVRGLLVAAGLYSYKGQLQVINIQTQAIDATYVPQISKVPLQSKTDLALVFEPDDSAQQQLIHAATSQELAVSHMVDAYTMTVPMALGFEVKSADASNNEALAQLAIWTTAQLRHAEALAQFDADLSELPPAVGFTVLGSQWNLYMTYAQTKDEYITEGPLISFRVHLIHDAYAFIRLLARIKCWLELEYFPWFLTQLQQTLHGENPESGPEDASDLR